MKRFVAVLGLLACAALMAVAPPKPKTPVTTVTVRAVAGLVWVHWVVNAAGAPDSVVVTVNSSVAPTTTNRGYRLLPIRDSISFPRPTFGVTINGAVNARSYRRGLSALGVSKNWIYTEPADTAPPAPTVDSVRVTPTSASLQPGGTVLLTATVWRS